MLEVLKIKNIAVIDEAELHFEDGLNILSGETGAGKSIVIESISLLLGARAQVGLIRTGCDEAVIEGLFRVGDLSWIKERLQQIGIEEASDFLIKRVVNRQGRHRIYVNGQLVTLNMLQELCDGLVDLCSQHEHQSLLKSRVQMQLLDRYGGLEQLAQKVFQQFSEIKNLISQKNMLLAQSEERQRRMDYLKFQIQEIEQSQLQVGEDELLFQEKKLLQSAENRIAIAEQVQKQMDGDSEISGALDLLRAQVQKSKQLTELDESFSKILKSLERSLFEMEDASLELNRYLNSIESDQSRLEEVLARLSLFADLKRKYGSSVEEILATFERLQDDLKKDTSSDESLKTLDEQIQKLIGVCKKDAAQLYEKREKVAKIFSDSVTSELKELNMPDAVFKATVENYPDFDQWIEHSSPNDICFNVLTNRGESTQPLGKVASGGELSRMMLSIRRVISDRGGIGVYLFDEIDSGIGGQTAFQVGKKLKSVSRHNQVICITHLPQVAAFADHHMIVEKQPSGKRTVTQVRALKTKEKQEEIARMLGGEKMTPSSLKNASDLMKMASV